MFETRTTWEDSGHDCDHCGGEVLRRTEALPNGTMDVSFQCRDCNCRWTVKGKWLQVGNGRSCQTAYRQNKSEGSQYSRRLFMILGVALLLAAARFGGIGALRYLLPLAVIGLIVWTALRLGREYHLW